MNLVEILFLLVLGMMVCMMVYLAILGHFEKKRDEKVLERVRNIDLGEGVTLGEGILAYFGEEGDWYVGGEDLVRIFAGGRVPVTAFHIEIRQDESGKECYNIRVPGSGEKGRNWLNEQEVRALEDAMVQAVKDHGAFPEA